MNVECESKMKKKQLIKLLICAGGAALLCGCGGFKGNENGETIEKGTVEMRESLDFTVDYEGIDRAINDSSRAEVHDPSIVKDNGKYYIFGSHLSAAVSEDLADWKMIARNYTDKNPVFGDLRDMKSGEFDFTGYSQSIIPTESKGVNVWAPDVIYNKAMGKYCMYGCTSSTFNASTIYFATADSIEGTYEWQANLLYSGETESNIDATNICDYVDRDEAISRYTSNAGYAYNYKKYPNCIDPTIFYDKDDKMWMVYGSWSGGIFLIEIDEETGLPIHPEDDKSADVDRYYGKRLLGGGHHSIEGPYILYDAKSDYYFLFVSYGELKRDGGYQIRVFRSRDVDGPYLDMNDSRPDAKIGHEYCGLKLSGNYYLPSLSVGYKATGHNSAFIDDDGRSYVAYHTRFDKASETHTPKAKQYFLNAEGWPCLLPYVTSGERISDAGYSETEMIGKYYLVNQGTKIDAKVAEPIIVYLLEDGSVKGENLEGTWNATEGKYFMTLSYDDKEYSGVFCAMKDEAGTNVMTFSAVGNNESIWGVKY